MNPEEKKQAEELKYPLILESAESKLEASGSTHGQHQRLKGIYDPPDTADYRWGPSSMLAIEVERK